jgi:hypothetical protein
LPVKHQKHFGMETSLGTANLQVHNRLEDSVRILDPKDCPDLSARVSFADGGSFADPKKRPQRGLKLGPPFHPPGMTALVIRR